MDYCETNVVGILDIISNLAFGQIARLFHGSRDGSSGRRGDSVDAAGDVTAEGYMTRSLSMGRGEVSGKPSGDDALM